MDLLDPVVAEVMFDLVVAVILFVGVVVDLVASGGAERW